MMCVDRIYPHLRLLLHSAMINLFMGVRIGLKLNDSGPPPYSTFQQYGFISNRFVFVDMRYT